MPKHTFKFPEIVIDAVKLHVYKAIIALDPNRYQQEANYSVALIARMEGIAYEGPQGLVQFEFTPFNDRGPKSAESRFGADYAITAVVSDGVTTIKKAILVQAKLGEISKLSNAEHKRLCDQIEKMKLLVAAPKVLQIPIREGRRYPEIISGNKILNSLPYRPVPLAEYFTSRVTTTLDGCTDSYVIEQVQDSALPQLHVVAKLQRN